ncbi:hypothetical protein [Marinobacter sp. M-5]|uniref:hypothetical protein n=1 Tax=Marinobacter sp. M-5 TaxID=3081089 RepID=UPI00293CF347|nr:hypothetical protein [Marinobacter sp. M-5]MDV3503826.1 hypothetical protein [Marinobacter sp. M-5]
MIALRLLQPVVAVTLVMALWPGQAAAEDRGHSFKTCSLITAEYLTVLQLASRGLDETTLNASLPDISAAARQRVDSLLALSRKEGLVDTHSRVHSEYAACARQVFTRLGMPEAGTRDSAFHFCAGENRVRYEITLAAVMEAPVEDVKRSLEPQHHAVAEAIYRIFEAEGPLVTFDHLAGELKHCLNDPGA